MSNSDALLKYILIVDDLPTQRVALKKAIKEVVPRSHIIEAESFVKAQKIIKGKGNLIDLAVIDLRLEGSDEEGIALIKMFKKIHHRKKAKTILITAYHGKKIKDLAKEAKADDYISKLDAEETMKLQKTVKKLLGL